MLLLPLLSACVLVTAWPQDMITRWIHHVHTWQFFLLVSRCDSSLSYLQCLCTTYYVACTIMLLYSLVLTVEWGVLSYGVCYRCAPSLRLDTAVFSRLGGGEEGMVLRGLVLLCPLPPS